MVERCRAAGKMVTSRLYEGGRREMLNEINRTEVVEDLWRWLELSSRKGETEVGGAASSINTGNVWEMTDGDIQNGALAAALLLAVCQALDRSVN